MATTMRFSKAGLPNLRKASTNFFGSSSHLELLQVRGKPLLFELRFQALTQARKLEKPSQPLHKAILFPFHHAPASWFPVVVALQVEHAMHEISHEFGLP